jgi:hypothetical protein
MTEEDRRQVHRELLFARRDRGRHTNRVKRLLAGQGVRLALLPYPYNNAEGEEHHLVGEISLSIGYIGRRQPTAVQ